MVRVSYEAALSRGGIVGSPLGMHQHTLSPPLTNLQDRENIRYTFFIKNDFIQVIRESMEQYTVDEAGTQDCSRSGEATVADIPYWNMGGQDFS